MTTPDINIHPPSAEVGIDFWTVSGNIHPALSNYDVQEAVALALPDRERFQLDSELGCFFAYTDNEDDAKAVEAAIRAHLLAVLGPRRADGASNPILSRLIEDIDGTIDTILGDAEFSDEAVNEALTGVLDRLNMVLFGDDGYPA